MKNTTLLDTSKLNDEQINELVNLGAITEPSTNPFNKFPSVFSEGFIFISFFTQKYLAEKSDFNKIVYRTFYYLCSQMKFYEVESNQIGQRESQVDIGKKLGIDRSEISKSLKILVSTGLVLKTEKYIYAINPEAAWKGRFANRRLAVQKYIESLDDKISFFELDFIKEKIKFLNERERPKDYLVVLYKYYQEKEKRENS